MLYVCPDVHVSVSVHMCMYIYMGGSEVIDGSHLPSTLALFFETWSFNEPEAFLFH